MDEIESLKELLAEREASLKTAWNALEKLRTVHCSYTSPRNEIHKEKNFESEGNALCRDFDQIISRNRAWVVAQSRAIRALVPYLGKPVPEGHQEYFQHLMKELDLALTGMGLDTYRRLYDGNDRRIEDLTSPSPIPQPSPVSRRPPGPPAC